MTKIKKYEEDSNITLNCEKVTTRINFSNH